MVEVNRHQQQGEDDAAEQPLGKGLPTLDVLAPGHIELILRSPATSEGLLHYNMTVLIG